MNGLPKEIMCDGNDIALSGGAEVSWGGIYINNLTPITDASGKIPHGYGKRLALIKII